MFKSKEQAQSITPAVQPLSDKLLEEIFNAEDWKYTRDDDGDLCGMWDGHIFYFMMPSESDTLMVFSIMRQDIEPSQEAMLRDILDEWHRSKFWPRATWQYNEERMVLEVRADHNVNYEHGVSKKQLLQHVQCAISTTLSLFSELQEKLNLEPISED